MTEEINNTYVQEMKKRIWETDVTTNWKKIFFLKEHLETTPEISHKCFLWNTQTNQVAYIGYEAEEKKIYMRVYQNNTADHLGNVIFDGEYQDVVSIILDIKTYLKTL